MLTFVVGTEEKKYAGTFTDEAFGALILQAFAATAAKYGTVAAVESLDIALTTSATITSKDREKAKDYGENSEA